ncbi:MAG TPA: hypothetical protein PKA00_05955 [Saprospiraceae bacterium]|nr:hypothetical protein [Saprospiraceae bacterium]HMQ82427.1 hypothetical protein [Saprospiraceae bacterium]
MNNKTTFTKAVFGFKNSSLTADEVEAKVFQHHLSKKVKFYPINAQAHR